MYLVDAHELAVPDQDAKEVLVKAASAATTEIEAKKVECSCFAVMSSRLEKRRPSWLVAAVRISSCSRRVLVHENPGIF